MGQTVWETVQRPRELEDRAGLLADVDALGVCVGKGVLSRGLDGQQSDLHPG